MCQCRKGIFKVFKGRANLFYFFRILIMYLIVVAVYSHDAKPTVSPSVFISITGVHGLRHQPIRILPTLLEYFTCFVSGS